MEAPRVEKSFCRICGGICAVEVTIDDNRIVQVRGDRSDPLTRGFACFKGLQAPEQHHGRKRLRNSLRRGSDGRHEPVGSEQALVEAAGRLKSILAEHGPRAIALFTGTQAFMSSIGRPFARAFLEAIGSPNSFNTMTIDQSAKWVADARLGTMASGRQPFASGDVYLAIGTNPLLSLNGGPGLSGFAVQDPVKSLKEAKARGLKLIVIDPRRTETAQFADLFLQPRAGVDAHLMAGILHVVLRNGWHDQDFCHRFVEQVDQLREALAGFEPEEVARVTDVPADQIVAAARMFALEARRGIAGSGTGTNMGPRSNLAEHLVQALNVVCGRFQRAGDPVSNPGVLQDLGDRFEEVIPPNREWETGPRSASHGTGQIKGQMMSATLADEILSDHPDRIRALVCIGGNPAVALPDEKKARRAMESLELLVTIDPQYSQTASYADFVIAPTIQFERPDHTGGMEFLLDVPYAHFTPALISPGPDMDVVDDWYAFWRIAKEMGMPLRIGGVAVDMDERPQLETLLPILLPNPRIPLDEVRGQRGGRFFPFTKAVLPGRPEAASHKLDLLPADVAHELDALRRELGESNAPGPDFPYRFTVRREREVMNSFLSDFDSVAARKPFAPAYLHPAEIDRLGLVDGDAVRISSAHGSIVARLVADPSVRRDIVQMAHCWAGANLEEGMAGTSGSLVDSDLDAESINHMPTMTAIPVAVQAL